MMNQVTPHLNAARLQNMVGRHPEHRSAIHNFGRYKARFGFLARLRRRLGHENNIKQASGFRRPTSDPSFSRRSRGGRTPRTVSRGLKSEVQGLKRDA